MTEIMSIREIETKFASEWVLVQDPQLGEADEVLAGRVLCHSKDRDEVYRKAIELRPRDFAFVYTGGIPENTAIVL